MGNLRTTGISRSVHTEHSTAGIHRQTLVEPTSSQFRERGLDVQGKQVLRDLAWRVHVHTLSLPAEGHSQTTGAESTALRVLGASLEPPAGALSGRVAATPLERLRLDLKATAYSPCECFHSGVKVAP